MDYVDTANAPKAIGPYSQAIKANGFVYTSGQTPLDPATGEMVEGAFEDQVHRVFRNLEAVLTAAGSSFSKVVKATVYVTDLANFQKLNAIYAGYFGDHKPARTTIQASGLPKGAQVEIDLVAAQ